MSEQKKQSGSTATPSSTTESWKSQLGVILAVAGAAVGLGNFLRFPGQAVQNGGGTFMIPYFIAFILVGLPICWAEWILGRHAGSTYKLHSSPGTLYALSRSKGWSLVGSIGVLIPVVVYMYYIVIESWCLVYAWSYLTGSINLGNDPTQYASNSAALFANTVGLNEDGLIYENLLGSPFLWWAIVFALNFLLIYRGLQGGIEFFCKYAMPFMALCALFVLARVLTLGTPNPDLPDQNVLTGLGYMWNPRGMSGDPNEPWYLPLLNPQVWIAAAGQIFFSLSVGFGVIINYASYLKKDDDVTLSALTASATNEFFEVCLGGMITIPAAFIFLGIAGTVGGTFGLGFTTLPVVFEYMPLGHFFGFIWFFMLFLAAITSSLSMLQPAVAFLQEALNIERKGALVLVTALCAFGSLFVIYFSKGLLALDTLDFWVGTMLIYLFATVLVIYFGWFMGAERGVQLAQAGAQIGLPRFFPFVVKYISPAYLIIMLTAWCLHPDNLAAKVKELSHGGVPLFSVVLIGVVVVALVLLVLLGTRRWQKKLSSME